MDTLLGKNFDVIRTELDTSRKQTDNSVEEFIVAKNLLDIFLCSNLVTQILKFLLKELVGAEKAFQNLGLLRLQDEVLETV